MTSNKWAYPVSIATRRREIRENTERLAQLDALEASGLEPFVREYGARWGWNFEPWSLIALSLDACAALGLTGEELTCAACYLEIDEPWIVGEPPAGWYARGKAIANALEARFGERIDNPADWKAIRAAARRRLRAAEQAIKRAA